jgi:hypothetical protein
MLGFKGQYVCPIRLLSHRVIHCDSITLGGGGTIATVISTARKSQFQISATLAASA